MKTDYKRKIMLYLVLIVVGVANVIISKDSLSKPLLGMWIVLIVALVVLTFVNLKKHLDSKNKE